MTDPRLDIITRRLEDVGKIIAVSSGKGGVGKSVVASALAIRLNEKGYSVGLLDLDFTSPSSHVILGIEGLYPEEEYGIIPPSAHGLRYMSITYYSGDKPAPLRGTDTSNAIIELLAITRWGNLDYLIIDMPPGIGDATLDVIRLVERIRFLVVCTPSKVAYETVRKQIKLLDELKIPTIGIVENMVMKQTTYVSERAREDRIAYLGLIKYDSMLEEALGDVDSIKKTEFYSAITDLTEKICR
jgi:ATP-binding protein involved in chromosome partitioning